MLRSLHAAFTDHPQSVGESYFAHQRVAASFGATMILAGLACLVHALLPFLFVRTGSQAIAGLYERMVTHRVRATALAAPALGMPAAE